MGEWHKRKVEIKNATKWVVRWKGRRHRIHLCHNIILQQSISSIQSNRSQGSRRFAVFLKRRNLFFLRDKGSLLPLALKQFLVAFVEDSPPSDAPVRKLSEIFPIPSGHPQSSETMLFEIGNFAGVDVSVRVNDFSLLVGLPLVPSDFDDAPVG